MIPTIKLLILLTYAISVFFISNYYILGVIAICNIILMIILKVPKIKALKNLYYLSFFILFTAIINYIIVDLNTALLIAIRLTLVCNFTYTFKYILSTMEIAKAIEILCFPFNFIGINSKDISLIVSIAITFIPIISNELSQTQYALKAKGINKKNTSITKRLQYILKPILYSIFRRTGELEWALKSKGYVE